MKNVTLILHMYLCTYVGMTLNVSMYVTVRLWIDNDVLVRIPPSLKLGDLGHMWQIFIHAEMGSGRENSGS